MHDLPSEHNWCRFAAGGTDALVALTGALDEGVRQQAADSLAALENGDALDNSKPAERQPVHDPVGLLQTAHSE